MSKKREYTKPVVQDLGSMMIGSMQMPMGTCADGGSPSGASNICNGGSRVDNELCGGGALYSLVSHCEGGSSPLTTP